MAYPVWPAGLPQTPDRDDWEEVAQRNKIEFEPEVGEPITRRRSTVQNYIVTGAFYFTDAQRDIFRTFWKNDLKHGVLSFTLAHPVSGASCTWKFKGEPPMRLEGFDRHRLSFTCLVKET